MPEDFHNDDFEALREAGYAFIQLRRSWNHELELIRAAVRELIEETRAEIAELKSKNEIRS